MRDNYSQRGGVRLGAFNATWPFAKIDVDSDNLRIFVFSKEYHFNKNEIVGLRKYDGLISLGLLVEHNKADYPHHIVFWTFNFPKLRKFIEALGYSIGEPKKSDAWWRGGP